MENTLSEQAPRFCQVRALHSPRTILVESKGSCARRVVRCKDSSARFYAVFEFTSLAILGMWIAMHIVDSMGVIGLLTEAST